MASPAPGHAASGGQASAQASIVCPSCDAGNRAHRGYCRDCGAALAPVCRGCRFVNERGDLFCGGCGSALVELPAASAEQAAVVRSSTPASSAGAGATRAAMAAAELAGGASGSAGRARPAGRRSDETSALLHGDSELAALFAPAEAATPSEELPSSNITQADLDKLFGVKS